MITLVTTQDKGVIRIAVKRIDLSEALGLSDPNARQLRNIRRDIETLQTRLGSVGVNAQPVKPKESLLSKTLRTLNVPGATVRGLIKAGIDPNYSITDLSPYSNPVEGIDLLDQLGLAPEAGSGFGRKAARFGLGLATDIVTDPLSWLAGGITKPLTLLDAPVIGKTAATLTKQGAAQPFLRGVGAGLRGTGTLGATLGDEGVLAARQAAKEASTGGLAPFSNIADLPERTTELLMDAETKSAQAGIAQAKDVIETALANIGKRAPAKSEQFGLGLGTKLRKENTIPRGVIEMFSPGSLVDPTYRSARQALAANVSKAQRGKLAELDKLVAKLTPEQQRAVTDLIESSGERSKYAYGGQRLEVEPKLSARAEEVYSPVREAQTRARQLRLGDTAPAANIPSTLIQDVPLEQLPEEVYQNFRYVADSLQGYGNERMRRGLLSALLDNYFPHKLNPDLVEGVGGVASRSTRTSQQSARFRDVSRNKTLKQLAQDPNAPKFEREFVRPFAREIVESERAIQSYDFFEEVKNSFGITADDMMKRYGYVPTVGLPEVVGDYKLVDFGQFMLKGNQEQAYAKLGKVYLPSNIADDMTRLHAAYNDDDGIATFVKLWDGASNFWKPLVTSWNPGFHVNNLLGNLWNSYLGGLTNPKRYRDGYDVFLNRTGEVKAGAHKLSFEKLHELAAGKNVIRGGFFENETGRDAFRLVREGLPKPVSESNIQKVYDAIQGAGRKTGTFVEGVSRASLFTDQMIKKVEGYAGELTDDVLQKFASESADHVNAYLFDYAHGLSKFENEIMRRIAPFWAWTRFNIPRQVIELIDQPGKFLAFKHVKDNLTRLNPYPNDVPPWLRESLPTGATMDGSPVFFNPKLPLQDISRLAPGDSGRDLLGMLNPLIKLPVELSINKSFYTGRPIEEYQGQTTQVLGGARVPTKAAYAVQSTLGAVGKAGSTLQAFAPDADATDKLRLIRFVFPGLFTYNVERQPISNAYAEVQRLRDLMRKFEDESGRQVPTTRQLQQMGLGR